MSAPRCVVPVAGGPLIGRGQPERLGLRRGACLVPPLCRSVAASPGGRLPLHRGLAHVGLRGSAPVPVPVSAARLVAVRRRRRLIPVPAPPALIALRAGFQRARPPDAQRSRSARPTAPAVITRRPGHVLSRLGPLARAHAGRGHGPPGRWPLARSRRRAARNGRGRPRGPPSARRRDGRSPRRPWPLSTPATGRNLSPRRTPPSAVLAATLPSFSPRSPLPPRPLPPRPARTWSSAACPAPAGCPAPVGAAPVGLGPAAGVLAGRIPADRAPATSAAAQPGRMSPAAASPKSSRRRSRTPTPRVSAARMLTAIEA